MCFNAPHIFSKVSPWYTIPTSWNNRTIWPWYLPLWCNWLLKLLLSHCSLNSRSLPKWDGRILKTRLLWSKG
ncbi:hypothetical protein HanPI659440_Chr07g0259071 [Helianthus annuus]|nr:hypothetical protein HanPI659440_Chr07g0259071 [Helianthus annuus]